MIVFDTHVLIWSIQDDKRLGRAAAAMIEDAADGDGIVIPAICAWEIAQIERRGKGVFPGGTLVWFDRILTGPIFRLGPFDPVVAVDSVLMDWAHKDPADRIIVATARHLRSPLLTADTIILAYAAAGHVEAIDARL